MHRKYDKFQCVVRLVCGGDSQFAHLSFCCCCCCFFRLSSRFNTFFNRKNNSCFSFRSSSKRVFNFWICSLVSPNVIASCRLRSSRSFFAAVRFRSSSTDASSSNLANNKTNKPMKHHSPDTRHITGHLLQSTAASNIWSCALTFSKFLPL